MLYKNNFDHLLNSCKINKKIQNTQDCVTQSCVFCDFLKESDDIQKVSGGVMKAALLVGESGTLSR